jgi:ABC-type lipoprotein export system ATPase subunit
MNSHTVVRMENVSKSYITDNESVPVLTDVDLTIHRGDKISLVGPSGSGKSTLLALIAGLLNPDRGSIEIDGVETSAMDDKKRSDVRAKKIGIALQSDNLIPFLTSIENVELALSYGKYGGRSEISKRADELLKSFDVSHRSHHFPRQLSGGEAQRVSLAVSMANSPSLLLADELGAQLDNDTAKQVMEQVMDSDFAVLFVTHNLEQAALTSRSYIIKDHKVVPR